MICKRVQRICLGKCLCKDASTARLQKQKERLKMKTLFTGLVLALSLFAVSAEAATNSNTISFRKSGHLVTGRMVSATHFMGTFGGRPIDCYWTKKSRWSCQSQYLVQ
jgi:hypothetical protein